MKTARRAVSSRKVPCRTASLSLSMRVERLEKAVLFPAAAPAKEVTPPYFTNLDSKGKPTAGEHVAVFQAATGLIWTAAPLAGGKRYSHANALQDVAHVDLLGTKGWRLPTIQELLSIIDYGRCDPAVDPKHFKGPYDWTWSSTVAAAPSGHAWSVLLSAGSSGRSYQSAESQVLAVRAGQQFGLGI